MVMFNCVECKQSSFGCSVFVLMGYCFLGEIRRYFLTAAHIAYSNQNFLAYFPQKENEADEITNLSVRLSVCVP
jgi:hypothetical protein